jgi:hypothetical protein
MFRLSQRSTQIKPLHYMIKIDVANRLVSIQKSFKHFQLRTGQSPFTSALKAAVHKIRNTPKNALLYVKANFAE